MHIVEVTGGLGNQMFQYAFGKYIKHRVPDAVVKYDISYFGDQRAIRKYQLDIFDIDPELAKKSEIRKTRGYFQYDKKYLMEVEKRMPRLNPTRFVQEDLDKGFQPEVVQADGGYYSGYWQCEKYFSDFRDEILKAFSLKNRNLPEEYMRFYEKAQAENTVSVHVRLGDYLDKGNFAIYGNICTADYYRKAVTYLGERISNAKYYIFTNDESKVKELLPENIDFEIVHFENDVDYLDMIAMSKCSNNIIANSSFSWWGAWLNRNNEKQVICPTRWFNNHEVADQLCDGWIRI